MSMAGAVEAKFVLTAENRAARALAAMSDQLNKLGRQTDSLNAKSSRLGRIGGNGAGGMGFGRMLGGLGVAGAAFGAARFMRGQLGKADQITDQADSMGLNVESAQTLKVLARDTAVSFESLGRTFARLNEQMIEAQADPESGAASAFEQLGIRAEALKAMSVDQVFSQIGKVMGDARTPAWQMAAALDVMGNSATKLGPVFEALKTKSLPELSQEMIKSGRIMDEQGIKKLAALEGRYEELQDRISVKTMQGMVAAADQMGNTDGNFLTRMVGPKVNEGVSNITARVITLLENISGNTAELKKDSGVFR